MLMQNIITFSKPQIEDDDVRCFYGKALYAKAYSMLLRSLRNLMIDLISFSRCSLLSLFRSFLTTTNNERFLK
jgi:hypothetical protein